MRGASGEKSKRSSARSRTSAVTRTAPGRATAVTRLARFTGREQGRNVEAGEHRGVADRLHQAYGGLGDLRGELPQASGQTAELVGRDPFAEPGEALEIGERDRHLARAGEPPGLALGAADDALAHLLAQMDPQEALHQRSGLGQQLGGRLGEAIRDDPLRVPGLDQHLAGVPGDRLGGVGHPVADDAHDLEKGFARDADVDVVLDRLHRLEVALGGPALVGARTREPEGHYRVRDELLVQACPLRELASV